ncbi:MAG TPA: YihY/virulence factor BrkB family protein [Pirellulales bacterium]|jgi:membrane protein|nr:YihY/virulence factor BrkB family protein [Pirellulales bacterium]
MAATATRPAEPRATSAASGTSWWQLIKQTFSEWSADKAPRLGAALAYYTVFSLPPLLVIVIAILATLFNPEDVQNELNGQFKSMLGEEGQAAIAALIAGAQKGHSGAIATAIGIGALVFGAAGLFVQLKDALNTIWGVRVKSGRGIWGLVRDYFLSFTMVVGIGFLLLVSLVVSAALSAALTWFSNQIAIPEAAGYALDLAISFLVVMVLFAMTFKVLPDVEISWRDVWLGAAVTSILFNVGKFLIGLYIGHAAFTSSYGAVGTVLIVLVWAYYSAQILLFGAEFTKVHARMRGSHIKPARTAEAVSPEMRAEQGLAPN